MQILVVSASKYGATRGIAAAIGDELARHAHEVTVREAADAPAPAGFDAAVIGSAVYAGSWLPAAKRYVHTHAATLGGIPVWLFSCGLRAVTDPQAAAQAPYVAALVSTSGAREHVALPGSVDLRAMTWFERLVMRILKARDGDFRDWDAVRACAGRIAAALGDAGVPRSAGADTG